MSRLKSAHDLSGLMKYASRAPWDEAMDDSLSAHLGPACEATGLDPDALFDLIGDHWEGPIWGCVASPCPARAPKDIRERYL